MNISNILTEAGITGATWEQVPTYQNAVYKIEGDNTYYLKIFFEEDCCSKLIEIHNLIQGQVPISMIIAHGKIKGHQYIIFSAVKGVPLNEANLDRSDLISFYEDFGHVLSHIHSITYEKFGEPKGNGIGSFSEIGQGPFLTWKEMHKKIIAARLAQIKGGFFEELREPIRKYFVEHAHLINYDITPRLLHVDLNQKNIFVEQARVSGIIDFDGCFVGHNEEELMRTECANFCDDKELKEAFFRGYTQSISLDEGYEKRRVFYYLSRLLVHMGCLQLFGHEYQKNLEEEVEKVRHEVRKILAGEQVDFCANR